METVVSAKDGLVGTRAASGRARIVAAPGYNRWLVPPAALAIHLCIGMIYGFSVFWLPMQRLVGHGRALACPAEFGLFARAVTTACDWTSTDVTLTFTIAIVLLGASAAIWGGWLERVGPRRAGLVAAVCWGGGLLVAAAGVRLHQLWLVWLGAGVIGGVGLGIGYISPVSTLIKWFPDRRGMATGMAIMGFGGGAMIGAPLATLIMQGLGAPGQPAVAAALAILGVIYLLAMTAGAFGYRVPPEGWAPPGWAPRAGRAMIAHGDVALNQVHRTPQFWLIWLVLMLNVSAGIGVISVASPMLQEIFGGLLIGHPELAFGALDADKAAAIALIAAGFTGLLSLFNIVGRFFWASVSDRIGRRATYSVFFVLGMALYAAAPWTAALHDVRLFVLCMGIILSMYGGGFATVPAYLADIFGTRFVGAIHGRLLTAWSTAGIVGPMLMTQIKPAGGRYDITLYILAGLLALGLACNLAVRPLARHWFLPAPAAGRTGAGPTGASQAIGGPAIGIGGLDGRAALAWLAVGAPIAWGVWITLRKAAVLLG
jgi:MFS family permease